MIRSRRRGVDGVCKSRTLLFKNLYRLFRNLFRRNFSPIKNPSGRKTKKKHRRSRVSSSVQNATPVFTQILYPTDRFLSNRRLPPFIRKFRKESGSRFSVLPAAGRSDAVPHPYADEQSAIPLHADTVPESALCDVLQMRYGFRRRHHRRGADARPRRDAP